MTITSFDYLFCFQDSDPITLDEDKLLNYFAQIYREVPHFRKMLLPKALLDTISNGCRRKCVLDPRWLKFCSAIQLISPSAYSLIVENNSNCLLPGEAALENASRGGAAQDDSLKNGPDSSGLELLDLSPENLQQQVSKVPSNWVWCCAADEISCVQVLVPFKDVFLVA